jgi:hypothetical protein
MRMNDFRPITRVCALALVSALALAGCSTEVAISPVGAPVADSSYNPVTGNRTLTGDITGDVTTIFHATNRALDGMGYFRVKQNLTDKNDVFVYARGVMDVYVTVEIKPAKVAGKSSVAVSIDNGSQPDAQAIFSSIISQVNNPSGTEAPVGYRRGS